MGKKLTAQDIDSHIEQNSMAVFDICSCCGGVEHAGTMKSVTDNIDDFDLICDECSHLNTEMERQVDETIDLLFANAHGIAMTTHGDITPSQNERLQNIKSDLKNLILEQTNQNKDGVIPEETGKKLFLFTNNPEILDLAEGNETKTFDEIKEEHDNNAVYSDHLFNKIQDMEVNDTIDQYNNDLYGFEVKRIK